MRQTASSSIRERADFSESTAIRFVDRDIDTDFRGEVEGESSVASSWLTAAVDADDGVDSVEVRSRADFTESSTICLREQSHRQRTRRGREERRETGRTISVVVLIAVQTPATFV